MANEKQPTTIKKYANRRLYNTGTSAYVTLEDLAEMVKKGEDFEVFDAKTSEDITRSVLTQIIFEQEGKVGQAMLPVAFLRQLIRFYGDSMQALVPSYLEFTLDRLTSEQQKFRDQFTNVLGGGPLAEPTRQMFQTMDEQARKNMAVFRQALSMFNPFVPGGGASAPAKAGEEGKELDELRKQVGDLQKRIDGLSSDRT
ncbi:MAG: polyhydroxyalkanoate synthesis repressor PhaR [Methylobacteriaceae bacterium]|nr:polyhydroxyalkanoate synthesis repressor PhaR [Rhodoblastus sp.]MCC0004520.1 polyhydroxyalkanoate synthesis repressor PhaR [Methylobacteriaceae bacterium]